MFKALDRSFAQGWSVLGCMVLSLIGVSAQGDEYTQVKSENGIIFEYKTHRGQLDGKISCETTGWVSVGFNPTEMMANANFIIGYLDLDQKVMMRDDFGTDKTHHKADIALGGVDNISNANGKIENGITTIAFTIPLDSQDPYDRPLVVGQKYKIILGCGKDGFKNFVSIHKKVATLEIQL